MNYRQLIQLLIAYSSGDWHCERASRTYDGIKCPEGHYKIAEDRFATHCNEKGLPCPDGYTCYCQPCIDAYDVDVFPWDFEVDGVVHESDHDRCDKVRNKHPRFVRMRRTMDLTVPNLVSTFACR